jgi:AraC-like DNA-binding protein
MLGPKASRLVPTATAMHFGHWLGWPEWLRDGTSLSGSGPLPPMMSLADDLMVIGNVIDHADAFALVERMLFSSRPIMGATGALTLLHAPDLNSAMQLLVRAMAAQNPFLIIRSQETADTTQIAFQPPWPMGPLFSFAAIAGIALFYRAIDSIETGDPAEMTLATQLHDAPEAQSLLAKFRCRIEPSSGDESLSWPRQWGAQANPHHDALMWTMAQSKVIEIERGVGDPEILKALRSFVIDMLENEQRVPRLTQTAVHLGMSSRSLVRLLTANGTRFHKLVEDERKAMALSVIGDMSITLAQAAQKLGFGDMSSFGRSVRLWFGDTPGNLRKSWSSRSAIRP